MNDCPLCGAIAPGFDKEAYDELSREYFDGDCQDYDEFD